MNEKLKKKAYLLDFQNILDDLCGEPYNISRVKRIVFSTKYIILGRGIINSEYFDISDDIKQLETFYEYFIPITSEEDLKALEDRIESENIEAEKQKELSEEELKKKLKQKIETEIPEATEEEKEKVFDLAIQAPTKKFEAEDEYWNIYDIVGSATKTREILNIKMEKPIIKNDFKIKDRKIKEEKNGDTNK